MTIIVTLKCGLSALNNLWSNNGAITIYFEGGMLMAIKWTMSIIVTW